MIRQMGILCERMNSGKVKVRGGFVQLHSNGTADILAFPRGRVVWIETKLAKGHTQKERAEEQERFRQTVLALGHEHYRITSIDEGLKAIRESV
jgi:hypothetical protein